MSLWLSIQNLAVKCSKKVLRLKQKYPVLVTTTRKDSTRMASALKRQKLVLEECELIIEINKKGECTFDVMSKVETVCNGRTRNLSSCSERGNGSNENIGDKNERPDDIVNGKETTANDETRVKNDDSNKGDQSFPPTSKYVALDCEFVGVLGDISALGRCSIVNYDEEVICDIYAQPVEKITHYRTRYSGITKAHMKHAIPLECALSQISDIIKDKIVVGHDINNDFRVLGFGHPEHMVRDTRKCKILHDKLKQENKMGVSLKNMANVLLGKEIQKSSHCSVIDATSTMQLYKLVREEWETSLLKNKNKIKPPDDCDQPPDDTDVSLDTKNGLTVDIKSETKNGKSNGKVNMSKKGKGIRPRFGQILGGSMNVNDYFKNNASILKNDGKKISEYLNKEKASRSSTCLDEAVRESDSDNVASFHMLRDGTKYLSPNPQPGKKGGPAATRKRKSKFADSEKLDLKMVYDKDIKQLFHDDFWNNMNSSFDSDIVDNVGLT